ncbi:MAG: PH domain-containing protein [Rhizomicrobium sp.]
MPYIDKSLGAGETVIARAQFHWLYSLSAWIQLLVPAALLVVLLSWDSQHPDFLGTSNPLTWTTALVALWFLLGLLSFLRMMIRKWTTEIGVTSHRFVEKYGALSMRTNEIALPNIEGVKVNQSLMGRILGYGTIRIEGTGVDAVTTPDIADPVGFVRAIQTAKEHVAQRFEQRQAGV